MTATFLATLFILSALPETPITNRHSEADPVYDCDFEEQFDQNFDDWPDDWTRRRGRGFPFYLPIEIIDDASRPSSRRCLKLELDGAAQVYSPRIEVRPLYSYVLNASLKTSRLEHDVAYCAVTFLDAEFKKLETHTSEKLSQTDSWQQLQIGPVTPRNANARWATIELHLEPTVEADLVGAALFDDIWFGRLPRMSIQTNSPFNVFTNSKDIEITCHVSGFTAARQVLRFELTDIERRVVLAEEVPLRNAAETGESTGASNPKADSDSYGRAVVADWKSPAIPEKGFYTVRASLAGESGTMIERELKLVVIEEQPIAKKGEFGWSLPKGDDPLSLRDLALLMRHVGIHWVKFPIWYSGEDSQRADALAGFAEWLNSYQMQLVGVLDTPPDNVRKLFGEKGHLPVASVFVEPDIWRPAVDPVMTRLSLRVRWWQLGRDDDTSFVNFPNLEEKLRDIRDDLNRFGQQINLGIALRSIDQRPEANNPAPWSFLSYTANPPLTADELGAYFDEPGPETSRRWLVLEPLSSRKYDLPTRASDLVLRMLAAKMQQVDGIFIPDPFDTDHGLMDSQGTPTELLLAWRTTATMISGAQYLGSIQLPNGSQNRFFVRGNTAVMVIWNNHPTEEAVYLGRNVEQVDVWGRRSTPAEVRSEEYVRQVIPVSKLPTFVTGVSPVIARWRMAFDLETQRVASVFGQDQVARYSFTNTFDNSAGGTVSLQTPIVAEARTTVADVKLAPGESQREEFHITLGTNTNSGEQPIQADFDITGHRFSVYRTIQVGLGDIKLRLQSGLDKNGNLVVRQDLENKTDEFVSFHCLLFGQGRRRQRRQVYNLSPGGEKTNYFVFPNGAELVGTLLRLRAEEIGGVRILNHVSAAQREGMDVGSQGSPGER